MSALDDLVAVLRDAPDHGGWRAGMIESDYRLQAKAVLGSDWLRNLKADLWDEAYQRGSLHGVGPLFVPNPYRGVEENKEERGA